MTTRFKTIPLCFNVLKGFVDINTYYTFVIKFYKTSYTSTLYLNFCKFMRLQMQPGGILNDTDNITEELFDSIEKGAQFNCADIIAINPDFCKLCSTCGYRPELFCNNAKKDENSILAGLINTPKEYSNLLKQYGDISSCFKAQTSFIDGYTFEVYPISRILYLAISSFIEQCVDEDCAVTLESICPFIEESISRDSKALDIVDKTLSALKDTNISKDAFVQAAGRLSGLTVSPAQSNSKAIRSNKGGAVSANQTHLFNENIPVFTRVGEKNFHNTAAIFNSVRVHKDSTDVCCDSYKEEGIEPSIPPINNISDSHAEYPDECEPESTCVVKTSFHNEYSSETIVDSSDTADGDPNSYRKPESNKSSSTSNRYCTSEGTKFISTLDEFYAAKTELLSASTVVIDYYPTPNYLVIYNSTKNNINTGILYVVDISMEGLLNEFVSFMCHKGITKVVENILTLKPLRNYMHKFYDILDMQVLSSLMDKKYLLISGLKDKLEALSFNKPFDSLKINDYCTCYFELLKKSYNLRDQLKKKGNLYEILHILVPDSYKPLEELVPLYREHLILSYGIASSLDYISGYCSVRNLIEVSISNKGHLRFNNEYTSTPIGAAVSELEPILWVLEKALFYMLDSKLGMQRCFNIKYYHYNKIGIECAFEHFPYVFDMLSQYTTNTFKSLINNHKPLVEVNILTRSEG